MKDILIVCQTLAEGRLFVSSLSGLGVTAWAMVPDMPGVIGTRSTSWSHMDAIQHCEVVFCDLKGTQGKRWWDDHAQRLQKAELADKFVGFEGHDQPFLTMKINRDVSSMAEYALKMCPV